MGGQSARSKANVRPNRWIIQCMDTSGGAETRSFRTMSLLLREYSVRALLAPAKLHLLGSVPVPGLTSL